VAFSERVLRWAEQGSDVRVTGRRIRVWRRDGAEPLILFLHGFPSSSYDWRLLLDLVPDRAALLFDCLGFGLSEKPRDHDNSLFEQADIAEALLADHGGPVVIVAHDMGTSVTTELIARDLEGRLGFDLAGALLFNGSVIVERASLRPAQRLLRSPLGPLAARLTNRAVFRRAFAELFSPNHSLSDDEADDQWELVCHGGGRTLGHRLITYIDERIAHAERWHGAVRDWHKPLDLAWGLLDPVATTNVLDGLRELRPAATVTELAGIGHYPQLEAPEMLVAPLDALVAASIATGR
jgi:pimeloyl-ACP methyl ester carboxylesterase